MGLRWIGRAIRGAVQGGLTGGPTGALLGAVGGAIGPATPPFPEPEYVPTPSPAPYYPTPSYTPPLMSTPPMSLSSSFLPVLPGAGAVAQIGARLPRAGRIGRALDPIVSGATTGVAGAMYKSLMGPASPEPGQRGRWSPRLGRYVKVRRMNVGNGKALRRAVRRIEAFEKVALKVFHFTRPTGGGISVRRHKRR